MLYQIKMNKWTIKKVKAISRIELTKDLINKFSILNGAKCFSSGIFQNYLVFMPAKKHIKYFSGTTQIDSWKSNGMLEGNIENINKSDSNLAPKFVDHHSLPDINFNEHCLISNISVPKKVTNVYISYKLNPQLTNLNTDFTLGNCLFRSVKLTKNSDLDKYKLQHMIWFLFGIFITWWWHGKNVIFFRADMSSFVHSNSKRKDILVLGEGPT